MLDDVAYWWQSGWGPRLVLVAVAGLIAVGFPWVVYDHSQEGPRWERYKTAHHCYLRYKPGELGSPESPSGYEAWDCDGRLIFKNPIHAGVGGQI